ncbi:FeoA family protein [Cyanobium sp. Morenito 9A2]|uniref:FeoA family protein n=1 Tax=Cyanobium sp. Morenito 9A2 TaxID=2823718 RepID=UPI0020CFCCB0|nr:FeoA family protein [Cyanobium sp. Morenito 9A2]MCP9848526.1 ferrous iron transport protein A [Cyanobium sp. Morenito 9A2]
MGLPPLGPVPTLAELAVGRPGTILSVAAAAGLTQRLSALGLSPGRNVQVLRRAWWSGPLHVRVGMTELMLRRSDAARIAIEPCESGV